MSWQGGAKLCLQHKSQIFALNPGRTGLTKRLPVLLHINWAICSLALPGYSLIAEPKAQIHCEKKSLDHDSSIGQSSRHPWTSTGRKKLKRMLYSTIFFVHIDLNIPADVCNKKINLQI